MTAAVVTIFDRSAVGDILNGTCNVSSSIRKVVWGRALTRYVQYGPRSAMLFRPTSIARWWRMPHTLLLWDWTPLYWCWSAKRIVLSSVQA